MTKMEKTVLLLQWWVCEGNADTWYEMTGRDFNESEFFAILSLVINGVDGTRINWSAITNDTDSAPAVGNNAQLGDSGEAAEDPSGSNI